MRRYVGDFENARDVHDFFGGGDNRHNPFAFDEGRCAHCDKWSSPRYVTIRRARGESVKLCGVCVQRCESYEICPLVADDQVIYAELLEGSMAGQSRRQSWVLFTSDSLLYEVRVRSRFVWLRDCPGQWRPSLASVEAILAKDFPWEQSARLRCGGPSNDELRAWVRMHAADEVDPEDLARFLGSEVPEAHEAALVRVAKVKRAPSPRRRARAEGLRVPPKPTSQPSPPHPYGGS